MERQKELSGIKSGRFRDFPKIPNSWVRGKKHFGKVNQGIFMVGTKILWIFRDKILDTPQIMGWGQRQLFQGN